MRRRGLGKVVVVFAALVVLLTAGMMSHEDQRHQYVWGYLWETATSEFSENDAPFAGVIIVAKDFVLYAAETFAVLCAGFFLAYLAGEWGIGAVLAGVLLFTLWPPAHDACEIALLFPLAGGAVTGFLMYRDEKRIAKGRGYKWGIQKRGA